MAFNIFSLEWIQYNNADYNKHKQWTREPEWTILEKAEVFAGEGIK